MFVDSSAFAKHLSTIQPRLNRRRRFGEDEGLAKAESSTFGGLNHRRMFGEGRIVAESLAKAEWSMKLLRG